LKLSTPGIIEWASQDKSCSFLFNGEIQKLVAELAGLPLDKMTITEPDLEEVFMHYYRDINKMEVAL